METAFALEKLFPKQCQVLGVVTPGIVGERKCQLVTSARLHCGILLWRISCSLNAHLYFWPSTMQ